MRFALLHQRLQGRGCLLRRLCTGRISIKGLCMLIYKGQQMLRDGKLKAENLYPTVGLQGLSTC